MSKKTVVFDFDGVIHKYSSGWKDGSIYDTPVDGIYDILKRLKEDNWETVIVSTRCSTTQGINDIKQWLDKYNLTDVVSKICKEKPPALVYVDDRAIKFDGNNLNDLVYQIEHFKTWQSKN